MEKTLCFKGVDMDIPQELREEIEKISINHRTEIIEESQVISKKYRENDGKGKKLVTKKTEALAYAISRMPATYCAVYTALSHTLKNYNQDIKSVYDIGAGTGAATWAVTNLLRAEQITCFEREAEMRKIGSFLMSQHIPRAEWKAFDLTQDSFKDKADLVITSYVINELTEADRHETIIKMWEATNGILVIIEPGTPEGFSHILQARKLLLEKGANIVAPCTHHKECFIGDGDWCSFYTRVARSKMQKQAKNGELGYEDEKFSYIAFSKISVDQSDAVILRHPQINSGYVKVKLCTQEGIKEKTYSKKDKELYKKVKKMDAGDTI